MSSTDLAGPPETSVTLDRRPEERWGKQMALIARTVAKDATPEELHMFLRVADRYNLDPLQHEIYCVKTRGKNGSEGRIAIIVGEQGRLKIANRYQDYRGFRSDVVCTGDRFLKLPEPKEIPGVPGGYTYVEHGYGNPAERGEIHGAWCEVYREGRPPVYFYAPLAEYLPQNPSDRERQHSPWFSTESRMIVKCADSTSFRMAFNLAGIYGEEEIEHIRAQAVAGEVNIEDEIEWGEDEEVADRMRSLFAAANNTKPNSYPPAKIRLILAGLTDNERHVLAAQEIIPFIRNNGGSVPEPGEIVVDEAEMEVEDDEPSAESHVEAEAEVEPEQGDTLPGM